MASLSELRQSRDEALASQFAGARRKVTAQKGETERQSKNALQRLAAKVGPTGGAIAKAEQRQLRDVGKAFGDVEAGLGAQEAAIQQQIKGQDISQDLAISEAEKNRELQSQQFQDSLQFQQDSFAQQMAFQWAEFDENLKTNFINAAIALKDSGLKSSDDWGQLFSGLEGIFGSRVPGSFEPSANANNQPAGAVTTVVTPQGRVTVPVSSL